MTLQYSVEVSVNGGSWQAVGTSDGQTSKTYSGSAPGNYSYRLMLYSSGFYGNGAQVADGPVGVTVAQPPSFSISGVTQQEGNVFNFTVTRHGYRYNSVVIHYVTANGSATAGTDYQSASGAITIPSGTLTATIPIQSTEDAVYEGNEAFYVQLTSLSGAGTISSSQATGTITNDDAAPTFTIANVSLAEGGTATFSVTQHGASAFGYTVNWATANGSAASGSDYTAASGALSFASTSSSTTTHSFSVATIEDAIYEASETFHVNLSGATSTQATGTITNDDGAPSFTIGSVSVEEGNNAVFTVTQHGASAFGYTVHYATANGTASSGSDYTAKSGNLTFASTTAASVSQPITVSTVEDPAFEAAETFYMNLSNDASGQATGTITNDDTAPSFTVTDATVLEGGTLVFTIELHGTITSTQSVNYASADATATAGTDYTAVSDSLSFSPSQPSQTVFVATLQNSIAQAPRTLYLNLSNPTAGTVIDDGQALGTINDDEQPPVFACRALFLLQ